MSRGIYIGIGAAILILGVAIVFLGVTLSNVSTELDSTKATLQSTTDTLAQEQAANAALQGQNASLEGNLTQAIADNATLAQANAGLAQDKAVVEANLDDALDAVDEWSAAYTEKELVLAAVNDVLAQTRSNLASAESDLADLQVLVGRKDQVEAELMWLDGRVDSSTEELEGLEAEIARLQAQVAIIPKPYADEIACTGSMEPAITCLDRVTFREVTDDLDLAVGNVVTWETDDCYLASECLALHRIIAIAEGAGGTYYLTKGDNNPLDDDIWLPRSDLVEAVVGIEKGAASTELRRDLRNKISEITRKYHNALQPCSDVFFTGGSCVLSSSADHTVRSYDGDIEYALCQAYRSFCIPYPVRIESLFSRWTYTFERSVLCTPPHGTRVVQTWESYRC